jgi:hypothetical protein
MTKKTVNFDTGSKNRKPTPRRLEVRREDDQIDASYPRRRRDEEPLPSVFKRETADGLRPRFTPSLLLFAPRFAEEPSLTYSQQATDPTVG